MDAEILDDYINSFILKINCSPDVYKDVLFEILRNQNDNIQTKIIYIASYIFYKIIQNYNNSWKNVKESPKNCKLSLKQFKNI